MSREWITTSAGVRGARHERRGEPMEDASGTRQDPSIAAIAVADGHGSDRCPRAARGAELAVEVALDLLVDSAFWSAEGLAGELVDRWRAAVTDDLELDPMPGSQLFGDDEMLPFLWYGTTLIAAAGRTGTLRLMQIGDGDVLLGHRGHDVHRPIPPRGPLPPAQTESLCQPDADERVVVVDHDLETARFDACLIATDGLDCAFADEKWHGATMGDLLDRLSGMAPNDLPAAVERWCRAPAESGGDDTSMAVLVDAGLLRGEHARHLDGPQLGTKRR